MKWNRRVLGLFTPFYLSWTLARYTLARYFEKGVVGDLQSVALVCMVRRRIQSYLTTCKQE